MCVFRLMDVCMCGCVQADRCVSVFRLMDVCMYSC